MKWLCAQIFYDCINGSPEQTLKIPELIIISITVLSCKAVQEALHRLSVIANIIMERQEAYYQFDVPLSFVRLRSSEDGTPVLILVDLNEPIDKRPMMDTVTDFLRAQLYTAGVQSLKYIIDACLIRGVDLLRYNGA